MNLEMMKKVIKELEDTELILESLNDVRTITIEKRSGEKLVIGDTQRSREDRVLKQMDWIVPGIKKSLKEMQKVYLSELKEAEEGDKDDTDEC